MELFTFCTQFFFLFNAQESFICNLSIILDKYQPDESFPIPLVKLHKLLLLGELEPATTVKYFMIFPGQEVR